MNILETPVVFDCRQQPLLGILHTSSIPGAVGVLVIVGGPQYRIGGSRQFVLLARHLASQNIPVFRFDVRGMGDSAGEQRRFDQLDDDIAAAIDCFFAHCPMLERVVLWGLCDGADAALFYSYQDKRVQGLILLNPWVYTEQGAAKAVLKHYYRQRLLSPDFWRKVFLFKFNISKSVVAFLNLLKQAKVAPASSSIGKVDVTLALPVRMRESLRQFAYPVLFILAGRDLTASEFKETVKGDAIWQSLLNQPQVSVLELEKADHTFSTTVWRNQVAEWTVEWVQNQV